MKVKQRSLTTSLNERLGIVLNSLNHVNDNLLFHKTAVYTLIFINDRIPKIINN